MGQSESTTGLPTSSPNFNPECEVLSRVNSPYYGDIKIVKDSRTGEQLILKDVTAYSEEAYKQELAFYDQRTNKTHPNIVRIFGYTSQDKQNFCSTLYKIAVYIETNARDLATELDDRINTRSNYTESDLLLVIENLVSGLSFFQTNESAHKDIRPFNIFVTEGQTYKISDPGLHPQRATGLSNAILGIGKSLLAPELISEVPAQNFDVKYDEVKADVFSFGITALALATLTNPEEFYDYTEGKIKTELIDSKLEQVKATYSFFTYELIKDCLTVDPAQRPDFVLLSNRLAPYQDDIRRRAPLAFFKDATPEKPAQEERPAEVVEEVVADQDQEVTKKAGRKVHAGAPEEAQNGETNFVDEALQRASEQLQKSQQLRSETANTAPADYSSTAYNPIADLDDLDARIKAALARSQETFRQIFANDGTLANNFTNYSPSTYTGTTNDNYSNIGTTNYSYTPSYGVNANAGYTPAYDYSVNYPSTSVQPVVQETVEQTEVKETVVQEQVTVAVVQEQPQEEKAPKPEAKQENQMEASTAAVEQQQQEQVLNVEIGNVNVAVNQEGVEVKEASN